MNTERICPVCDKQYTIPDWKLRHGRGLTCSYQCGRISTARKLSGPKESMAFVCGQCGKITWLPPHLACKRKYCSPKCSQLARRKHIVITCARCGKKFEIPIWRTKRTQDFYCSPKCQFPLAMIKCGWCGKERRISPSAIKEHNFCSRKCLRAWLGANGILGQPRAQLEVICATCGKEFKRQRNQVERSANQYCSKECFYKAHEISMAGEKNPAWRGGLEPYYGPNWKRQSRQTRARDNHRCQRCGISEIELGKRLHIHHIIALRTFDRDFRRANALKNLVSLCPSCHKFLEWHEDQMIRFLDFWRTKTQLSS